MKRKQKIKHAFLRDKTLTTTRTPIGLAFKIPSLCLTVYLCHMIKVSALDVIVQGPCFVFPGRPNSERNRNCKDSNVNDACSLSLHMLFLALHHP